MLVKPNDYDSAQAYDGTIDRLPAGGYVCKILKVSEGKTMNGSQKYDVNYDIVEGPYAGFFLRQYNASKSREITSGLSAKWRGVYTVFPYSINGGTNPYYKGLLTCIERSNGIKINPMGSEDQLNNKLVGLLVREEEFEGNDGKPHTTTKACMAVSVESIRTGDYTVPQKKELKQQTSGSSSRYGGSRPGATDADFVGVDIDNDELPF